MTIAHRRWQTARLRGVLVGAAMWCAATSDALVLAQGPGAFDISIGERELVVVRDGKQVVERRAVLLRADGLVVTAETAQLQREQLDSLLEERIVSLDVVCSLSDAQRRKLRLAGRGDVNQYLEGKEQRVRKVRALLEELVPPELRQQLVQKEIRGFVTAQSRNDPFGEESLFQKTMRGVLAPDQLALVAHWHTERDLAAIISYWDERTKGITLSNENRHKLAWLVVTKGTPPSSFSRYAYQIVLLQLAELENDVRPFFDDSEWPAAAAELKAVRDREPHLRKIGEWPVQRRTAVRSDKPSEA